MGFEVVTNKNAQGAGVTQRPHLSVSSQKMWIRCKQQWKYRYIDGIKTPPSVSLTFGSVFDNVFNKFYGNRIDKKKDITVNELRDTFSGLLSQAKEETIWGGETIDEVTKEGENCVTKFHDQIARHVNPLFVQKESLVPVSADFDLKSILDVVDVGHLIIDNKTANKRWKRDRQFQELQPLAYAYSYKKQHDIMPTGFRFDIAVRGKDIKSTATQMVFRPVDEVELEGFENLLKKTWEEMLIHIRAGIFPPNPTHDFCSRRYCGYWEKCQAENKIIIRV